MKKRVVITGIGVATPIGCEKKKFWENLCSGKSSISDLHLKGLEECYSQKYGLLDPEEVQQLEAKLLADAEQNLSKCSKLALVTAIQAVQDANISFDTLEEQLRTGVFFGTTQSDQYAFTEELEDLQRNRFTAPVHVAKHFHLHGSVFFNANLCASGNHALGYAWDAIQSGKLDTVLAGGVDVFSTITYVGFNRLKALSVDSVKPFDRNRNGTILSEGAAVFVLEELEHAKKRNAPIYGEIIGYGMSNDAYNIVAPDPTGEGVIQAMERAIAHSGISYQDIDFVALHGTSTAANDSAEAAAIRTVFREHTKDVSATAIKGALGHQLGAASAVAMAVCALVLQEHLIPPTINVSDPEELDFQLVTQKATPATVNTVMNNAYAFGGSNCCVVLKRWCPDHA